MLLSPDAGQEGVHDAAAAGVRGGGGPGVPGGGAAGVSAGAAGALHHGGRGGARRQQLRAQHQAAVRGQAAHAVRHHREYTLSYTPSTQSHLSISIFVPQFKSVCREEPRVRCSDHVKQDCSMDCSPVYWCRVCSNQDQEHNNIFY